VQGRTAYRLRAVFGASSSEELRTLLLLEQAIAAKPADLLVKIEAENPRCVFRLTER
jgi:hypothetical protein